MRATLPCIYEWIRLNYVNGQAYIANYTGHAKVDRLLFIAERSSGKPLELEALRMAHDELKKVGQLRALSDDLLKIPL